MSTAVVESLDARTGAPRGTRFAVTDEAAVEAAVTAARQASGHWSATSRQERARVLNTLADALEAGREQIVETADAESALGPTRLNGELSRTCFQFSFLAEVILDGGYLEATVDHADDSPMGPRPDLRRMMTPLGPVAVFGASNFPLAFSVPGGDTASALAAGCPVVIKAHSAHPETAQLCADLMVAAVPEHPGLLSLVHGRSAGPALVRSEGITAVGFTGSTSGGRLFADLCAARPTPIPFYGELGGVNALVVTPSAASARAQTIGTGIADSFTLGGGQFCTKPGIALLPGGPAGDEVRDACLSAAQGREFTLLTEGIRQTYVESAQRLGESVPQQERQVGPAVIEVDADTLATRPELLDEVFGPFLVVVRYPDVDHLGSLLAHLPGALTGTVHAEPDDPDAAALVSALSAVVGRVVWNGYPTGVSVGWAQHHGGPAPSTNTIHSSVGASSLRRWVRPLAWQSMPEQLLPAELRDGPVDVPRRVDGHLELPAGA